MRTQTPPNLQNWHLKSQAQSVIIRVEGNGEIGLSTNYPLLRVGDNFILSIFGYDDLCKSRLKKQPKAMLKSLVYSYHNLLSVSEKDNRGLSPYCLLWPHIFYHIFQNITIYYFDWFSS